MMWLDGQQPGRFGWITTILRLWSAGVKRVWIHMYAKSATAATGVTVTALAVGYNRV